MKIIFFLLFIAFSITQHAFSSLVNDGQGNINIFETNDGTAGSAVSNYANIYVADDFGNALGLPVNTVQNVPYNIIVIMQSGDPNSLADQINPNNWSNILMSSIGEYTTENLIFESRVQSSDYQFSLQQTVVNDLNQNYGHTKCLSKDPSGITTYDYQDNTNFQYHLHVHTGNLSAESTIN